MTNLHRMALARRFLRSRKGNIAIISALLMPAIVGFCGLAGETAYWYYRHRDIQGAADLAAFGGAAVLRSGGSSSQIVSTAKADAVTNGWRQANGTIAVNWPPTSGSWQNQQSVQVILTENQTRYFSKLFNGNGTVPISVRSTATVLVAGPACILGLNNTLADTVQFWGNSTATLTNCNVATNSSSPTGFSQSGASNAWMPCAYSSGGETHTAGLHLTSCGAVVQHHPKTDDPYKNVPPVAFDPASCAASNPQGVAVPLLAQGCFNSMVFQSNNPTILTGGNYVINGGIFQINSGADVRCIPVPPQTGCMFYFANNAHIDQMNGNAHIEMQAQTSGPYAGLAFFGARTNTWYENFFNGTNDSLINGAIYFPSQKVTFNGNFTGTGGCTQVIADQIRYTGNGTFNTCSGYGMKTALVYGSVSLVE
jgi:Flp pilus assembly protein TadG